MRKFLITLILVLVYSVNYSQNDYGKSDDTGRIVLNTYIPSNVLSENTSARKIFRTKLTQIASRNGLAGGNSISNNRFIISGDLNILNQNILPTAPPKYTTTIETTIAVGDGLEGTLFAAEYVEFKGVGMSQEQAFIDAIRKINPRNKALQDLLENGKQKIIEFYNSQCDFILTESQSLANSYKYDEALYKLSQVPKATKQCFELSMDLAIEISKNKFEFECSKFLSEAKAHWAARNPQNTVIALAKINAIAPCFNESLILFNEISEYLDEREQREYKDNLELRNRVLDNERAEIDAIREIGVAFGKNQPKNIGYKSIF